MRTTFVSTTSLWNSSKSSLDKLQTSLVKANKELVTGRDADVGLKLGYKTGQSLSLRQDRAELDALADSNASTLLRMKSTTTALDQIRTNADKFMDSLISASNTQTNAATLKYQAAADLSSMLTSLNSSVGGQYIFGGLNSQQPPMKGYDGGALPVPARVDLPLSGLTGGDQVKFKVGGSAEQTFTLTTEATVDDVVTSINAAVAAGTLSGVQASKDPASGHLVLASLDATGSTDVTGTFTDVDGAGVPVDGAVTRTPKAAIASAFKAAFGFDRNSPAVSTITSAQMKAFIDGPFANLFKGSNWADWSGASSQNIQSRISPTTRIEASANANDGAIQEMAMAYTMVSDLGIEGLNADTRDALIKKSVEVFSGAVTGISDVQARLGTAQEKINQANDRMDLQKTIFDEKITQLEAVDPAEAKTRIDHLTTQIQTAYSLTAQLKSMSLINFI